ncbi:hypothetical protein ACHAW5_001460 [Stephanodiscus triporus]|uniref:Uncharacterized protein n=1 Tax=Stephanodiscus triporus TaxID=2934178 RepID=A0ABD3N3V0_9STRA
MWGRAADPNCGETREGGRGWVGVGCLRYRRHGSSSSSLIVRRPRFDIFFFFGGESAACPRGVSPSPPPRREDGRADSNSTAPSMSAHARRASPAAAAIVASRISIGRAPPPPSLGSIRPTLAVGRDYSVRVGASPRPPPRRPSRRTLAGGPERRGRSLVRRRLGLSSYSSSTTTTSGCRPAGRRIFRIGADDDGSGGRAGRPARLSNLSPRLSAALEDHLLARMNGDTTTTTTTTRGGDGRRTDDHDRRLVDPILGRSITRVGLDWVRSISVPSSTSSRFAAGGDRVVDVDDNDDDEEYDDKDSIVVTIRPPTMLHPRLDELAAGVADLVREGAASWIEESGWSDFLPGEEEARSHRIGVTVDVYPTSSSSSSSSSLRGVGASSSSSSSAASASASSPDRGRALRDVSHVLAVYSCKGGVGKSTVAVNLAYRLSASGGRIGLVDLDVYGPSLPLLVRPDDPTVRRSSSSAGLGSNAIEPIVHRGVKLMSLGYVSPDSGVPGSGRGGGAAVMRGPMAGKVVRQLLHGTNWGSLDVLVLDLPPGTGDVQLEACQSLSLSGAVAVSTPSALAWADVDKGVRMFGDMGVPTLAVVENMSYFVCEGGGRHYPFGKSRDWDDEGGSSSAAAAASHYLPGMTRVFRLPISSDVHESNESGIPLCCDGGPGGGSHDGTTDVFKDLADAISADLLVLGHGGNPSSTDRATTTSVVTIDEAGGSALFDVPFTRLSIDGASGNLIVRLFSDGGGYQKVVAGIDLRRRDPRTGEEEEEEAGGPTVTAREGAPTMQGGGGCGVGGDRGGSSSMVRHHASRDVGPKAAVKDGMFPTRVTRKGNYGYEVEWGDGLKIIYSLLAIAKAAGGKPHLGSLDRSEG